MKMWFDEQVALTSRFYSSAKIFSLVGSRVDVPKPGCWWFDPIFEG